MSISGNDDIFTRLERGLHAALRADPILAAIVRECNWVDFTQPYLEPVKDSGVTADMPELRVAPSGLARLALTSDSSAWVQSYQVVIVSGDKRTSEWHNRAKQGVLCAVQAAKQSKLQLPTLVIDVTLAEIDEGPYNDTADGTRHAGWVMRANVQVRFRVADWSVPVP